MDAIAQLMDNVQEDCVGFLYDGMDNIVTELFTAEDIGILAKFLFRHALTVKDISELEQAIKILMPTFCCH